MKKIIIGFVISAIFSAAIFAALPADKLYLQSWMQKPAAANAAFLDEIRPIADMSVPQDRLVVRRAEIALAVVQREEVAKTVHLQDIFAWCEEHRFQDEQDPYEKYISFNYYIIYF